jgi:hypothetical protein
LTQTSTDDLPRYELLQSIYEEHTRGFSKIGKKKFWTAAFGGEILPLDEKTPFAETLEFAFLAVGCAVC